MSTYNHELREIHALLSYYGLKDHPGMKIGPSKTGYNNYSFGCSAGPSDPNIEDLCHELAHAVQFGSRNFEARVSDVGFNFIFQDEYATHQPSLRELETFAIQAHLLNGFRKDFDLDEYISYSINLTFKWMHDSHNIPGNTIASKKEYCFNRFIEFYLSHDLFAILSELFDWLDLTYYRITNEN